MKKTRQHDYRPPAMLSFPSPSMPFPPGWERSLKIGERSTTNVPFVDRLMNGGATPGESYGIMGLSGVGKTTLAMMLSVSQARAEFERWGSTGRQGAPGRSYHFSYDDPLDDLRLLSLSYLAEIPKERLARLIHGQDDSLFSTTGNYRPYELVRFRTKLARGVRPPGELERFERSQEVLNACWRPFDMSGADLDNPGRGHGLVDEIAEMIHLDLEGSGARCMSATVDPVTAAIESHFAHTGRDRSQFHTTIMSWSFEMKRQVAQRFNCWCWSMQQLDAETKEAKPGQLPKVTDSAECNAFADNCDVYFVMGVPTRNGQMPFVARKHRRSQRIPPTVITLRGDLARIVDDHEAWTFDEPANAIVRIDESAQRNGSR